MYVPVSFEKLLKMSDCSKELHPRRSSSTSKKCNLTLAYGQHIIQIIEQWVCELIHYVPTFDLSPGV